MLALVLNAARLEVADARDYQGQPIPLFSVSVQRIIGPWRHCIGGLSPGAYTPRVCEEPASGTKGGSTGGPWQTRADEFSFPAWQQNTSPAHMPRRRHFAATLLD